MSCGFSTLKLVIIFNLFSTARKPLAKEATEQGGSTTLTSPERVTATQPCKIIILHNSNHNSYEKKNLIIQKKKTRYKTCDPIKEFDFKR